SRRQGALAAATFARAPIDFNATGQAVFLVALGGVQSLFSASRNDACDPAGGVLNLEVVLRLFQLHLDLLVYLRALEFLRGIEAGRGRNRHFHEVLAGVSYSFILGVAHRYLLASRGWMCT